MIKQPKYKVLFILGPPACGKGTQSQLLCNTFNFKHLSAGELLREELSKNTENASIIRKCMKEGTIVPVEITCMLLKQEMIYDQNKNIYLIDGFPRNFDNFNGWMKSMSQHTILLATINLFCERVLYFLIKNVLYERLKKRSEKENRIDDKLEIFNLRMEGYEKETLMVFKKLKEYAPSIELNGDRDIDLIHKSLYKSIKLLI